MNSSIQHQVSRIEHPLSSIEETMVKLGLRSSYWIVDEDGYIIINGFFNISSTAPGVLGQI